MTIDETSKTLGMLLGSVDSIRNQTASQWTSLEQLEVEIGNNKLALKGVLDAVADLEEQVAKLAPIVTGLQEFKLKSLFLLTLIGASGAGLTLAGKELLETLKDVEELLEKIFLKIDFLFIKNKLENIP